MSGVVVQSSLQDLTGLLHLVVFVVSSTDFKQLSEIAVLNRASSAVVGGQGA